MFQPLESSCEDAVLQLYLANSRTESEFSLAYCNEFGNHWLHQSDGTVPIYDPISF